MKRENTLHDLEGGIRLLHKDSDVKTNVLQDVTKVRNLRHHYRLEDEVSRPECRSLTTFSSKFIRSFKITKTLSRKSFGSSHSKPVSEILGSS